MAAATAALATPGSEETTKLSPSYPLATRFKHSLIAFALQKLLITPLSILQRIHELLTPRNTTRPTLVKSYPSRRSLSIRVFFPPGAPPTKTLPTLLTIHGGGFVLGHPRDNDIWNSTFAARHSFLVIALNYTKAPSSPFPQPIYDLEALIASVLSDPELPVDASRVALAGFSAGGNLALAVSQLETIRSSIRAVIPLYPVVDFVPESKIKVTTRRWKPELGGFRAREADYLMSMAGTFNWAYVKPGQRCDHPLLSPYYAEREMFPRGVFMIGCELDMLGQEAWRMACKLAGREVPAVEQAMGREEVCDGLLVEGDERFGFEERVEGGWYKWLLVPDVIHGFDQQIGSFVRDEGCMKDARGKAEKVIEIIGEWLIEGPFGGR